MASKVLMHTCCAAALFMILLPVLAQAAKIDDLHSPPETRSPFDFLRPLKGCHRGDRVKGLGNLKKYLEHFGYLQYPSDPNTSDAFDDLLEHAVKTYQANYQLNVTGTLDDDTLSYMMRSRCGVPDIVNGTNWMQHHHGDDDKKKKHGSMFHQVSHFTFFPGSPKWPRSKTHLTYGFYTNVPTVARTAIQSAFNTWGAATRFSFTRVNYLRADLKIRFERRAHGDGSPFDGRGGTLAHAFAPTDGRAHFDADELWSAGAIPNRFDIKTVALHEIGHLLGLGHSSVRNAIMFPSIASNTVKGLAADDLRGISTLYR
uniref:Peptidase metallopeptidase domain-containing protein n=1 Tax=Kalanchoe fedtschenkoi TaxID=63787 RepID=A0A7N0R888_KALFE